MHNDFILRLVIAVTILFIVFVFFIVYITIVNSKLHLEKRELLFSLGQKKIQLSIDEHELMMSQVSQEVHDSIGQIAYLSRMRLHVLADMEIDTEKLKIISEIAGLASQIISTTKYISYSLNSDFIKDKGLYGMLEYDLEIIKASRQMSCYLDVEGDHQALLPEAQLLVYRIAQEAIHNTLKHANASLMEIELLFFKDGFKMVISDDGIGFNLAEACKKEMLGLTNMNHRAALLNGKLNIDTKPGKGSRITLEFTRADAPAAFQCY